LDIFFVCVNVCVNAMLTCYAARSSERRKNELPRNLVAFVIVPAPVQWTVLTL